MPPKASTKRKAANGYKLPDPIPEGEIFSDSGKKKWRLGKSIGVGGFGEIYLCCDDINSKVIEADATHVMKVEPSENGPLFVEMHFYTRAATESTIQSYKKERGIKKDIGIPTFRGKGLHSHNNQDYRFLVIDRFGKDLEKIFQTGKKIFAPKAAYNLAIRIIDALEYIHSQGYVHNDIKAQNLLLGHGRKKENDVYLVDFGLVSKYKVNGVHMEYKPDARKAHDGTIQYTSRDAHIGAHSRRSDLEILGYNLVHWMSGNLPWMSHLTNPVTVHNMKKNYMNDIVNFLQNCFGEENDYPNVLEEFLNYVAKMDYDTKPDYDKCREMFRAALKKLRLPSDGKVDFSATKSPLKKVGNEESSSPPVPNKVVKKTSAKTSAASTKKKETTVKKAVVKKSPVKKVVTMTEASCQTSPAFVKAAKAAAKKLKKESVSKKNDDDEYDDEEMSEFIKKAKTAAIKANSKSKKTSAKKSNVQDNEDNGIGLENPTPAMLAIMQKKDSSAKRKPIKSSSSPTPATPTRSSKRTKK